MIFALVSMLSAASYADGLIVGRDGVELTVSRDHQGRTVILNSDGQVQFGFTSSQLGQAHSSTSANWSRATNIFSRSCGALLGSWSGGVVGLLLVFQTPYGLHFAEPIMVVSALAGGYAGSVLLKRKANDPVVSREFEILETLSQNPEQTVTVDMTADEFVSRIIALGRQMGTI